MKVKFVILFCVAELLIYSLLIAGGSSGGSGPPAKEALEQLLMSPEIGGAAGLFVTETGEIRLGVKGTLDSDLLLSKSKLSPQSLVISDIDFQTMTSAKNPTIDAVTIGTDEPKFRSYRVMDGNEFGELVLKDRRHFARE